MGFHLLDIHAVYYWLRPQIASEMISPRLVGSVELGAAT